MNQNSQNSPVQNVVFDRAAGYYDQTRGLAPAEADQLAAALWQALAVTPTTRVLEIGVGTGRIAGPLAQRGLSMAGIDTPKISMRKTRVVGKGSTVHHFNSAHLLSAFVVNTSSPGSFLTIL